MDNEFEQFLSEESHPFDFEFNTDDVVNREDEITDPFASDFNESKIEKKAKTKPFITEQDLEQILNYKDDSRRDRLFDAKITETASSDTIHPDNLHQQFNDYLILPKISGDNNRIPNSMRLPADYVKKRGSKVEIADDPDLDDSKNHPASVIVSRDQYGEVESIEVICKCGERTFIKFDFADENDKFDLTEIYNKEITDPKEFDMKKYNEKIKVASVNIEDIFSVEDRNNMIDERKDRKESSEIDDFEKLLDSNFS